MEPSAGLCLRGEAEMLAGVACRLCHEDQLQMECCRGGLLGSTGFRGPLPDDDKNRFSALPDDLLLRILARLRCARAAAHSALLARRWRGLWACLPQLIFHRITPGSLDAALAVVARATPALDLLDIDFCYHHDLEPARVSSLLRAAAALAPAELVVCVSRVLRGGPVELPCLERTVSIKMNLHLVALSLPPAGGFPALEILDLEDCHIDLGDMVPRCPRLRKLCTGYWTSDSVVVNSPSLEELSVYAAFLIRINIVTPALKKLYLHAYHGISKEFSLSSFSAPAVEDITWKCGCRILSHSFGVDWLMWSLTFSRCLQPSEFTQLVNNGENMSLQLLHPPHVGVLSLNLETDVCVGGTAKTFEQEISRFQVTSFSILELDLTPRGHVYGAIVLHLLGLCSSVQMLKVTIDEYVREDICYCYVNCCCDQPNNWRNWSISFPDLKEIEFRGFRGKDHEVDLLKVLLRCTIVLERVTMRFSRKIPPSDSRCMEIDSILKTYPHVKCNFYRWLENRFCRYFGPGVPHLSGDS